MLSVFEDRDGREENEAVVTLDDLARAGAQEMLRSALEVEVAAYVERHQDELDPEGHRLVVRNGQARPRKVTCGAGTLEVSAPRINDKRVDEGGDRQRFTSRILPPYMRRSPKVSEVLPILYLRGLSTGDFKEALPVLLGEDASGLSATNICRLTAEWEQDYKQFRFRSLEGRDYVYVWADGVHFNVRLKDDRLCTLVLMGARPDGTKEILAVEDGYRESADSWKDLLRDLKRRGMQAPAVAIGDGALGFWSAVREVWPETREQRDWFHKMGNILDKLPKRLHGKVTRLLRDVHQSETKDAAEERIDVFAETFGAKHEKAVKCLVKDREVLLTYYDFPAEHWKHLRTSNPIESAFATVRLRQRVTKGAGSRTKALTMAFKLLEMAEQRWRRLDASHLLPLVRAGVRFVDGVQMERDNVKDRKEAA
jgi:transposase-like protein